MVLIDEYDVPLAKANENGYYEKMILLIRNLFENVLKTNDSLKFAVLTAVCGWQKTVFSPVLIILRFTPSQR